MYQAKVKGYQELEIEPDWLKKMQIVYDSDGRPTAVFIEGSKYEVYLIGEPGYKQTTIYVDGLPFEVELLREVDILVNTMGYNQRQNKGHKIILAPMPGHVIRLAVEPGQEVTKGTKLLTLEAMKMENTVQASESGTIKEIFVSEGQTVSKGDPLIEIE